MPDHRTDASRAGRRLIVGWIVLGIGLATFAVGVAFRPDLPIAFGLVLAGVGGVLLANAAAGRSDV